MRVAIYIGIAVVLFSAVIATVFYFYRDAIGENILLKVNDLQEGEVSFSEVSLSPFVYFPAMSVKLGHVSYQAKSSGKQISKSDTIISLRNLYASINFIDLIKGKINISKVTLEKGTIQLIRNPDSSINLINALGFDVGDSLIAKNGNKVSDSSEQNTGFSIVLDEVVLKDIRLDYKDLLSDDNFSVDLEELQASIHYLPGFINSDLDVKMNFPKISLFDNLTLYNKSVQVQTAFLYNIKNKRLDLKSSTLTLEKASFKLEGYVELQNKIDLKIDGSDTDFSFFKLYLSDTGLRNSQSGEFYFNGTIKGSVRNSIPNLDLNFGLRDVNLFIPEANESIEDLQMEGWFSSGNKKDFSEAQIRIDNLKGKLPGGYVNAHFYLEDFINPKFDLLWDLESDLKGLPSIFKTQTISNLEGRVSVYDNVKGHYDSKLGRIVEERSESSISFDSLSMIIPNVMDIKHLNGQIKRNLDTLEIIDLACITENSDILINGSFYNALSLIMGYEEDILAELNIKSKVFDLPQIFAFEPRVGESFPYRILDMDMDVKAISSTSKLLDFNFNPEIQFEIKRMGATIENLLPPLTINGGDVLLSEKEDRIYMTFQNFNLEMQESRIKADVEYFSPLVNPDFLSVEAQVSDLDPSILAKEVNDTISKSTAGNLNGFIKAELEFGLDTLVFETFNILTSDISYIAGNDTIDIFNVKLQAHNIEYSTAEVNSSIFSSLSGEAILKADRIRSKHFDVEEIYYDVIANDGLFTVSTEQFEFLNKTGRASYVISPFQEVPYYEVMLDVKQFLVDDFLVNMLSDTVLTGKMDLNLKIRTHGNSREELLSGLDGNIMLVGHNLTLHGLDMDKLITRYNRSQNFNLVDLGAIMVAGPFGLAVTKGSEFASLALGNRGETTNIPSLNSEWNINKGNMVLRDVAFSTNENLIAADGSVDLTTDTLNITVAVLNKNGCSVLSQSIFGSLDDPQQSDVKVLGKLIAPITNLIEGAVGKDCEVFYKGKLEHPLNQKKN